MPSGLNGVLGEPAPAATNFENTFGLLGKQTVQACILAGLGILHLLA